MEAATTYITPSLFGEDNDSSTTEPKAVINKKPRCRRIHKQSATTLFDFSSPSTQASKTRDAEAWKLAFGYRDLAFKIARNLTNHPDDVNDLVQDGMLYLYGAARQFDITVGTKYVTTAYVWLFRGIKASWDLKHKRGITGMIDSEEVPGLFIATVKEDGNDDIFARIMGDDDEPVDEIIREDWWELLPDEPAWLKNLVKLKWVDFLEDKVVRREIGVRSKADYKSMLKVAQKHVADLFGVDKKGNYTRDESPGRYSNWSEEKWLSKWNLIPADREDLREVALAFFRRGEKIRDIAKDWYTTSEDIENMIEDVKHAWKRKKGKPADSDQKQAEEHENTEEFTGVQEGHQEEPETSGSILKQHQCDT